jgi:asparagine N-glycosylation enzyme membrane subunit Stt3
VAFLIAAGLSLVTIALAWLAYRPVFAGILFAVVAALVVLLVMKLKKGKAKQ